MHLRQSAVAVTLAALIVVAGALRAIGLNDGLWFDEILTLVQFVRPTLGQIVTEYSSSNNHPLYSVLANVAVAIFGEHAWALRLPAFLFGVAAVPAIYGLGREVTNRLEALLAAALIAVSYHHIWFSQNARGYTALAFFATVATWLFLKGWRSGNRWCFVWYGIISALGVYTHLTMTFVVAGHAITAGWQARKDPAARRLLPGAAVGFALAAVGAMVLYGPMAVAVYAFFSGPPLETTAVATPSWAVRETLRGLNVGLGAVGALGAGILFVAGVFSYWKQDRFLTGLFIVPGVVTAAALLALHSPIRPRFFFFLSGFAVLLVVRGATVIADLVGAVLPQRIGANRVALGTGLVALIVLMSLASLPNGYRHPKQDYEGAMHFVDTIAAPGMPVFTAGLAIYPYREYYGRAWQPVETESDLRLVRSSGQEMLLVYTFPEYTDAALMQTVADECRPLKVFPATVAGGDIVVCAIPALRHGGA